MLAAGDLRERVTIQQRAEALDAIGENTGGWVDPPPSGSAEPLSGNEYFAAGQQQQTVDVRFPHPLQADVTGLMRVVWRGDAHDIVGPPIDAGGRHEYLELMTVKESAMAGDIQVKVSGIEDVKKALRDLPVKLRKRALLECAAPAAGSFETRRVAPRRWSWCPFGAKGAVIRQPGTVRR